MKYFILALLLSSCASNEGLYECDIYTNETGKWAKITVGAWSLEGAIDEAMRVVKNLHKIPKGEPIISCY